MAELLKDNVIIARTAVFTWSFEPDLNQQPMDSLEVISGISSTSILLGLAGDSDSLEATASALSPFHPWLILRWLCDSEEIFTG